MGARQGPSAFKLIADGGATGLGRDRLDVAIRFGPVPFPEGQSIAGQTDELSRLLPEAPAPARARAVYGRSRPPAASHLRIVGPAWPTWKTRAEAAGLGPAIGRVSNQSRPRFIRHTDSIKAAISAGAGRSAGRCCFGATLGGRDPRLGAAKAFRGWIAGRFEAPGAASTTLTWIKLPPADPA